MRDVNCWAWNPTPRFYSFIDKIAPWFFLKFVRTSFHEIVSDWNIISFHFVLISGKSTNILHCQVTKFIFLSVKRINSHLGSGSRLGASTLNMRKIGSVVEILCRYSTNSTFDKAIEVYVSFSGAKIAQSCSSAALLAHDIALGRCAIDTC